MPRKWRVEYPGAIYRGILKRPQARPAWLQVHRLRGEKGIPADTPAGRREWAGQTEQRRQEEMSADDDAMRRGWFWGSLEFRQDLLAAAADRPGQSHDGADRQETGEQKAQRLVREEFKRLGRQEKDLPGLAKGDKTKVALARRLRQETTMSLKWIARRLHMGSWTYVSNLLHEN